jgi:hypothetical protein
MITLMDHRPCSPMPLPTEPYAVLTRDKVSLANSYYVHKSPLFHRLVNPGGNATIWVHA